MFDNRYRSIINHLRYPLITIVSEFYNGLCTVPYRLVDKLWEQQLVLLLHCCSYGLYYVDKQCYCMINIKDRNEQHNGHMTKVPLSQSVRTEIVCIKRLPL